VNAARAAQLLEANEQLVLAVIRAEDEAAAAPQALTEVSRSRHLAGLAERADGALLFDRLTHAIASARRSGARLGLLFVSIDNFKEITDAMGHAVGDQVLALASRRLGAGIRASDTVSRQGASDFLVLLTAVASAPDAISVAESLVAALVLPTSAGGASPRLQASIGISVFPDDGEEPDGLVDRATAAMYRARRRGLGSFFFRGESPTSARSLELRGQEAGQAPPVAPGGEGDAVSGQVLLQREANENLLLAALHAHELLEAAELANQRQLEFMGVVAHELRNPLGPITNAAALLGHAKSGTSVLPMVKGIIERQVAHLTRLVADLLDLTRVSTGKMRLEISRIDIVALVAQAVDDARVAVAARGQQFDVQLPGFAVTVNGDWIRLGQVAANLIGNASKYTPEGGAIEVSLEVAGASVVLTVADNGIGITPEALLEVFEPFVQEQHATDFNGSGLGIGLALVRELVHGHGGRVTAASAGAGHGSRFTVTLPVLRVTT
jgi:diguanylate cyclase